MPKKIKIEEALLAGFDSLKGTYNEYMKPSPKKYKINPPPKKKAKKKVNKAKRNSEGTWLQCPWCHEKFVVDEYHLKLSSMDCSFCGECSSISEFKVVDYPYDEDGKRCDGRIDYIDHVTGRKVVKYIEGTCHGCIFCKEDEENRKFAWCSKKQRIIDLETHERCDKFDDQKKKDPAPKRIRRKIRVKRGGDDGEE